MFFNQTTIRFLLCGLLFAGQIPGWLHVSGCGELSESTLASPSATACGCCVRGISNGESSLKLIAVSAFNSQRSHDCNDCLICRSMVSNNADQIVSFHFIEFLSLQDILCHPPLSSYVNTRVSFAQARAPPLV